MRTFFLIALFVALGASGDPGVTEGAKLAFAKDYEAALPKLQAEFDAHPTCEGAALLVLSYPHTKGSNGPEAVRKIRLWNRAAKAGPCSPAALQYFDDESVTTVVERVAQLETTLARAQQLLREQEVTIKEHVDALRKKQLELDQANQRFDQLQRLQFDKDKAFIKHFDDGHLDKGGFK